MSEPDDKAFDDYLDRHSPVSNRYRELDRAEPPPELDRLVLAHATQAARPAKSRAWMRWSAPVALAASLAVVVAVVIESGVEKPVSVTSTLGEPQRAAEQADFAFKDRAQAVPLEESAPIQPAAPVAPPAATAQAVTDAQGAATQERTEQVVSTSKRERDSMADLPVTTANVEKMVQQEPVASPPLPLSVELETEAPPSRAISQISARRVAIPPPTAIRQLSEADDAAEQRRRQDPDAWLEHIRQLRREQKIAEADQQWREFREAYPEVVVAETDEARPD